MPNPRHYRDDLSKARRLRHDSTDAERSLWHALRSRQVGQAKFRRQHPVAGYVLDFYCATARLGIELDGGQHAEPSAKTRDTERARDLKRQGIRLLRFWDNEVLANREGVLQRIAEALAFPSPLPSPEGRGREKSGPTEGKSS